MDQLDRVSGDHGFARMPGLPFVLLLHGVQTSGDARGKAERERLVVGNKERKLMKKKNIKTYAICAPSPAAACIVRFAGVGEFNVHTLADTLSGRWGPGHLQPASRLQTRS